MLAQINEKLNQPRFVDHSWDDRLFDDRLFGP